MRRPLPLLLLLALVACDDDSKSSPTDPRAASTPARDAAPLPDGRAPVSCDDCAVGARRCAAEDRVEVCLYGDDGCARWGAPVLCADAAARCRGEGVCCVDACDAEGATRCEGDGVRACAAGPDGCLGFGPPAACPDGETCVDGACRGRCGDGCTVGELRCLDAGSFAVCAEVGEGCTRFSDPFPCDPGQRCVDGTCVGCEDTCVEGQGFCLDARTLRGCAPGADGCRAPMDVQCPERCVEGACVAGCDACAADATRCVGGVAQRCAPGGDGCLGWIDEGPCAAACVDACAEPGARRCAPDGRALRCVRGPEGCLAEVSEVTCALGAERCLDAGRYQSCVIGGDGCAAWSDPVPCAGGANCFTQGAQCRGGCADACVRGDRVCVGADRYRVCEPGPDGCTRWVEQPCFPGADCATQPALCAGDCRAVCQPGERRCGAGAQYEVCVTDDAGCPAWAPRPCEDGVVDCFTARDRCFGACEGACTLGEKRCAADGDYELCEADFFSGCPAWTPRFCNGGADCAEAPAACFGDCRDACPEEGFAQCTGQGETFRRCERGADGCLAYVEQPCVNPVTCFQAPQACFGECQDACVEGARECVGADGFRRCVRAFGCAEWSNSPCFGGASCDVSPPACFGDCQDACAPGTTRCGFEGDTWQACERDPESGCLRWSAGRPCVSEGFCAVDPEACVGAQ